MAIITNTGSTSVGEDVEKQDPTCIAGGTFENSLAYSQHVKHIVSIGSSNSTRRSLPKRTVGLLWWRSG